MRRLRKTGRVRLDGKFKPHRLKIDPKKRNSKFVLFTKALYKTKKYRAWRKAVFRRDRYTCQICQARKTYFEAHHLIRKALHPELTYVVSNGICLCGICHRTKVTGHEQEYEKELQEIVKKNTMRSINKLLKRKIKRL